MGETCHFNIVLVAPEIPQNTGSIGRLCVNTSCRLHLVKPLGFQLDESHLRRAGMDYWHYLEVTVYENWEEFLERNGYPQPMYFCSTKGARVLYSCHFKMGDWLVFGNEGHGLPQKFYELYREQLVTLPMPGEHCRSLNLANSVSIAVYEGLRQILGWS